MKYRTKTKEKEVDAVQWWKVGNHPNVEQYGPDIYDESKCRYCHTILAKGADSVIITSQATGRTWPMSQIILCLKHT